jgi:hypothetical protein
MQVLIVPSCRCVGRASGPFHSGYAERRVRSSRPRRYDSVTVLIRLTTFFTGAILLFAYAPVAHAQMRLIGDAVDVSDDFTKPENDLLAAIEIDLASGSGKTSGSAIAAACRRLQSCRLWLRLTRRTSPPTTHSIPSHPSIEFVNARTIRPRRQRGSTAPAEPSLMCRRPAARYHMEGRRAIRSGQVAERVRIRDADQGAVADRDP